MSDSNERVQFRVKGVKPVQSGTMDQYKAMLKKHGGANIKFITKVKLKEAKPAIPQAPALTTKKK